jgi:hypothetical protein
MLPCMGAELIHCHAGELRKQSFDRVRTNFPSGKVRHDI